MSVVLGMFVAADDPSAQRVAAHQQVSASITEGDGNGSGESVADLRLVMVFQTNQRDYDDWIDEREALEAGIDFAE